MMSTVVALRNLRRDTPWAARCCDLAELTKPRIVLMELITIAMGFYLAAGPNWSGGVMLATLLGTGLVAGSASAWNMLIERHLDAVMQRTCNRPLPAGRVEPATAAMLGGVLLGLGSGLLYLGPGWPTLAWGLVCWVLYVVIYTPLKTVSPLNTAVGAASGAIPILMGWIAAGGGYDLIALGLFGVLYLWQYPHFMAIAWRCKEDYQRAGYAMSTTVDPTGQRAGIEAVVGALLLFPVSLLPIAMTDSLLYGTLYSLWTLLLAVVYLQASLAFQREPNDATSRRLLRVSLLYLPCWLLGLFLVAL